MLGSQPYGSVVEGVARLFGEGTVSGLSEGQLLDRFLSRRDPVAFEALVAKHGPMVLAVCRRVLQDSHAADDAFQATFLVLVRKAASVRGRNALGPWLHRVAYRVAIRAGKARDRRQSKEVSVNLDHVAAPVLPDGDLGRTIDQVLDSLPEKYRAPVVLCYLEGRTHDEAATTLRWPIGSVKGRLSRARELIKRRLQRLGIVAPAGAILTGLSGLSEAAVPQGLRESTVEAAIKFAAGEAIAAGTVSAMASILAEEAARAMTIKKLGMMAASLAALGMCVGGAAVLARQDGGKPGSGAKATAVIKATTDLDRLQGYWQIVSSISDGVESKGIFNAPIAPFLIEGDTWKELIRGSKRLPLDGLRIRVNEASSPNKALELHQPRDDNSHKGWPYFRMIYKLEGDSLTLCRFKDVNRDEDVPGDFTAPAGSGRVLIVVKRESERPPATATKEGDAKPAVPQSDLDRLQGRWVRATSKESAGAVVKKGGASDAPSLALDEILIEGDQLRFVLNDGETSVPRTLTLDEQRSPHQFEWRRFGAGGEEITRGIYRIDADDTFTLCYDASAPLNPPSGFPSNPSGGRVAIEYRRVPTPAPPSPEERAELARLQGEWRVVAIERDGESRPVNELSGGAAVYRLCFEGSQCFQRHLSNHYKGDRRQPRTLRLNLTSTPRVMELQASRLILRQELGAALGPNDSTTFPQNYKLDGDTLLVCATSSENGRPAITAPGELVTRPGDGRTLTVYERVVPAPAFDAVVPPSSDLAKLQGTWDLVRTVDSGNEIKDARTYDKMAMSFRGNRATLEVLWAAAKAVTSDFMVELDESKTPRVIRIYPVQQPGVVVGAIYRIEGNELTWASTRDKYGRTGKPLPADFQSTPGDNREIKTYRRRPSKLPGDAEGIANVADGPARTERPAPKPALSARQPEMTKTERPKGEEQPATATSDGPTGAETAAKLRNQADDVSGERDSLLDSIESDEINLEIWKDLLRDLRKELTVLEVAAPVEQSDARLREEIVRKRVAQEHTLTKRVDEFQKKVQETARIMRLNRRKADLLEIQIADLRAKADKAAKRPGKPNTAQVGDILLIEVLQALSGRPISGERLVRPDGTIGLGFYGDLAVVGLTRNEIKVKVIVHLRKYLEDEPLGLIIEDPRTGKQLPVEPIHSDRVFVDDSSTYWPR